jgi:hypothetical protein
VVYAQMLSPILAGSGWQLWPAGQHLGPKKVMQNWVDAQQKP